MVELERPWTPLDQTREPINYLLDILQHSTVLTTGLRHSSESSE